MTAADRMLGGRDVLVHNAGIAGPTLRRYMRTDRMGAGDRRQSQRPFDVTSRGKPASERVACDAVIMTSMTSQRAIRNRRATPMKWRLIGLAQDSRRRS